MIALHLHNTSHRPNTILYQRPQLPLNLPVELSQTGAPLPLSTLDMPTLTINSLQSASAIAGDGPAVVFATGPPNACPTTLLNPCLDLKLSPSTSLTADALPSGPLVLSQTLDSSQSTTSPALATALAGTLLLAIRFPDLDRPSASPVTPLFSAIETSLALRCASIAPLIPARRLFILAVRDYEPNLIPEHDMRQALTEHLTDAFNNIDLPEQYAGTGLEDFYDLQFVLLPSHTHCPTEYSTALRQLAHILRDANKCYADAGMTPERFQQIVNKLQTALADDSTSDLPADRELSATFACNAVMHSVLEKHRNNAKQWKATVDAGRIIRNFGTENDRLIEKTLQVYDQDASAYKSTRAFQRKKDELKTVLLSDAYALFAKQILKVRENAYRVFRDKLARIRINYQVEKNVRGAVKEAELFFIEHGESLRSKLGNWRFDNERHELVNHMRDDATERLQLARLQGNYVPRIRTPIAFAFHTLLLAPFGTDSRFAHPHAEDMKQSYDPDKVKQAGLMRARPHQRGPVRSVGANDEAGNSAVERFANLFEDEEGDKP